MLLVFSAGETAAWTEPLDYLNVPQVPIDSFNFEGLIRILI
jgi:hypothetical protein